MLELGVNIDHVATVRQARRTNEPDPVHAAALAELGGADQITVHLREDRRHIQDRDVRVLRETSKVRLNLELGLSDEIVGIALDVKPDWVCVVPESREEITTEGGLDVLGQRTKLEDAIGRFHDAGIRVSPFIDPNPEVVAACIELGADAVELHTGVYANATSIEATEDAIIDIQTAINTVLFAAGEEFLVTMPPRPVPGPAVGKSVPLVNLGHGLTYRNLTPLLLALLPSPVVHELNIGHSIVSRAVMVGMVEAVREMKKLMRDAEAAATQQWLTGNVAEAYPNAPSPDTLPGESELI